jgi:hypothetical protein
VLHKCAEDKIGVTEKVDLIKEKEPYLATLYGKALDNRTKNSILGDVSNTTITTTPTITTND